MNISCSAEPCPIILDSTCVFYTGANLIYTGILTNDSLCTALIKINNKFKDASIGYVFENGIIQFTPGAPVKLGGTLTQNTVITSGAYTFALTGTIESTAFITTGGTSSQFVKGDGSLDNTPLQPGGNYITALTGDGTAAGPGSAVFTLASVNATFGTWGSATQVPIITTDVKGRITNITPVTITIPSGILSFIGDVTGTGLTGSATTLTLATVNSNVYATDTPLIFSVNGKGLVTSAAPFTSATIQSILGFLPIGDAPSDGTTYGRRNGAWSAVTAGTGTVTSVAVTNGTGISASVANPTTTPNITITNTAPDQTVVLNNGTGISVTGTYPNFTINATGTSGVSSVTATSPLFSSGGATPNITIQQASGSQDGYLSSGDWTIFNNKQNTISLTTTGTSGAATFIANTLNIPQYQSVLTNPVTGTGTPTRVAFWDTGSSISSDADLYWDNTLKRLGIGITTPGYKLDVNGTGRFVNDLYADEDLIINNYFTINTTATSLPLPNALPGIWRRAENSYGTKFLEDEQGGAKDKWAFVKRIGYNETREWFNTNSSTVNINLGWQNPNESNLKAATLLIDPKINITATLPSPTVGTVIRGIYYNPNVVSDINLTHIGFENTSGDNYLNSSSGNTLIGYSTPPLTPFKLEVNGEISTVTGVRIASNRTKTGIYPYDSYGGGLDFYAANSRLATFRLTNPGGQHYLFDAGHTYDNSFPQLPTASMVIQGSVSPTGPNSVPITQLLINPTYAQIPSGNPRGTGTLRGILYSPTVTSLNTSAHVAFENTSGDIIHGNLATGGGTQMVTVDNTGKLGATTIPTGSSVGFEMNFLLMGA